MLQAVLVGFIAILSIVCPEPPTITLIGSATVYLQCNEAYVEEGATAHSVCWGDLTPRITINASEVDIHTPDKTYKVFYTVSDFSLQPRSITVERLVEVRSEFSFGLIGHNINWQCNEPYDDLGAFAYDDCEGDLTQTINIEGVNDVLTGMVGEVFVVTYEISPPRTDPTALPLHLERQVTIVDSLRPVISLEGGGVADLNMSSPPTTPEWWQVCISNYTAKYSDPLWPGFDDLPNDWFVKEEFIAPPLDWNCNKSSYEEPGASAIDNCEGILDPEKIILILTRFNKKTNKEKFEYVGRMGDINIYPLPPLVEDPSRADYLGYRAYYITRDSSGKLARQSRLIDPHYEVSITGVGGTTVLNCGDTFSPMTNVSAYDLCEGDITTRLVITGQVNTALPGTYTLFYSVSNNYGTSRSATRRIDVLDNLSPVITLLDADATPTQNPGITIPWCAWRASAELHCEAWWNEQYWQKPFEGWQVADACDDNDLLTQAVQQTGSNAIRAALEILQAPREQGIDPTPYLGDYVLYHNVKDTSNNPAVLVQRIVTIVPTRPVIILKSGLNQVAECSQDYIDAGIQIISDVDAAMRPQCGSDPLFYRVTVIITNPDGSTSPVAVNELLPLPEIKITNPQDGEYKITFVATNPLGEDYKSAPVVRTVTVGDKTEPEFVIDGFIPIDEDWDYYDDDVFVFICLDLTNLTLEKIKEFFAFTVEDTCAGDLTDSVEYVSLQTDAAARENTILLSVMDTAGNETIFETPPFRSSSLTDPVLTMGDTWIPTP
ncbi:MAG: DUF5011 domain-containing protein, partial [Candidatus Hydrogenedentes bacterium]|nr:DUF5011 domain-containing protein [Candidatus Hydrogenedentota bacterium]